MEQSVSERIQDSIVTALTIAAALIWKEFIVRMIEQVIPKDQQLLYHFLAALAATVVVAIALYLYLKTTRKAREVVDRFNGSQETD